MTPSESKVVEAQTGYPRMRFDSITKAEATDLELGTPVPFVAIRFKDPWNARGKRHVVIVSVDDAVELARAIDDKVRIPHPRHRAEGSRASEASSSPPGAAAQGRLATVPVSAKILAQWLKTGTTPAEIASEGLPLDAYLVGAHFDGMTLYLSFASESFPIVPPGSVPPLREIAFRHVGAAVAYFAAGFGPPPAVAPILPIGP